MKLNMKTSLFFDLGYGKVGTYLAANLAERFHLTIFPVSGKYQIPLSFPKDKLQLIIDAIKHQEEIDGWTTNNTCFSVWHEHLIYESIGTPHVTMSFCERNVLDNVRINCLQNSDFVVCPSTWWQNVIRENGVTRESSVVPIGVNREVFYPGDIHSGNTVFLNIGKTEVRKGHDVLVEIFNSAFTQEDDVELWIMWDNPFHKYETSKMWRELYKNSPLGNKITFLGREPPEEYVAEQIRKADCLVLPTRAEGFCLPALEALSCGRHLIITNYSGHTEFVNEENSRVIHIDKMETAFDGEWFFGGFEWAHLGKNQIDECIEHMRSIHRLKQNGELSINKCGIETAKKFSWESSTKKIGDVLESM